MGARLVKKRGQATNDAEVYTDKWQLSATNTIDTSDPSENGWAWDVIEVDFNTNQVGGIGPHVPGCRVFDSGNNGDGWHPENAFNNEEAWWGGRKEGSAFFIGVECESAHDVLMVNFWQPENHYATNVTLTHNGEVVAQKATQPGFNHVWLKE